MSQHAEIYNDFNKRAKVKREEMLKLLRANKENGVTNDQLQKISLRFNAMISHLRTDMGYKITVEHVDGGLCKYYLESEPDKENHFKHDKASSVLLEYIDFHGGTVTAEKLVEFMKDLDFTMMRKPLSNKGES